MPTIELTDDEFRWVSIAIEDAKSRAEQIAAMDDEEDAMDGNYLVTVWADLQIKFPPTEISSGE